jgi:hypothetical protein
MDDDDYEVEGPEPLPEVKRISGIYLQEAAKDPAGLQRIASAPRPTLPREPFSERVGEIVHSPGFKGRLVALAVLFTATGGMWSGGIWLAADFTRGAYQVAPQAIGSLILMMFAAVATLVLVGFLGAVGLTILNATADGLDRIERWPTGGPVEWTAEGVSVLLALLIAGMPGYVIANSLGLELSSLIALVVSLSGLAFPWILLSQLEQNSLTGLLSLPLLRRAMKVPRQVVGFYLRTLPLVAGLAAIGGGALLTLPIVWLLAGPLLAIGSLIYFRLLGRLAWVLAEVDQ